MQGFDAGNDPFLFLGGNIVVSVFLQVLAFDLASTHTVVSRDFLVVVVVVILDSLHVDVKGGIGQASKSLENIDQEIRRLFSLGHESTSLELDVVTKLGDVKVEPGNLGWKLFQRLAAVGCHGPGAYVYQTNNGLEMLNILTPGAAG